MVKKTRKQVQPSTPTRQSPRLTKETPADRSSSDESDSYNTGKGPNVAKTSQHPSKKDPVVHPNDTNLAFEETASTLMNTSSHVRPSALASRNERYAD